VLLGHLKKDELKSIRTNRPSEHFYRLMNQVMPNWEKIKERLDGMASVITNTG
jgi:hypothetical protein